MENYVAQRYVENPYLIGGKVGGLCLSPVL